MTDRNDLLDHAVDLFPAPTGALTDFHDRWAQRHRNRRLAAVAAVVAIWLVIGVAAVALGSRDDTVPVQTPSPTVTSGPDEEDIHGWPARGPRQPAGIYSWDASPDLQYPNETTGFMHNGYEPGSGSVNVLVEGVPGRLIPHRGDTPVTVAGFEGTYRRFIWNDSRGGWMDGLPSEEWMVDIQGTTVTISLLEEPGARETEMAEAREIIESIRVEPQDNDLGFRLLFTLVTDTWDSG